jgi:uncharacterized protein (TIGR03437 family)
MRKLITFLLVAACGQAQQYVISTLAGGPAIPTPIASTSPSIGEPAWVAFGLAGDVYFTNGSTGVYKVDPSGLLTRPSGNAPLGNLAGVAVDASGNLYLVDTTYQRLVKLSSDGTFTTLLGGGQLASPAGVAVDPAGNVYVADAGNYRVRKVGVNGAITTVAGTGSQGYSGDGFLATSAQLSNISGVSADAFGNIYIADTGNQRIRKVASTGVITTIAGSGTSGYSGDGGPAVNAQFSSPSGITSDFAGTLYIGDSNNHRVRRISTSGIITSVAGSGFPGYSAEGGPAATAQLNKPTGVAVDPVGNLYLADRFNYRIRKIATTGSIVTISGNGYRGYSINGGSAASAQLDQPRGLALDSFGNLYVADGNNCIIRKIAANGVITTVAGTGVGGYSGDNGPATNAQLAYQLGVAVNAAGELFIADSYNHRIRKVSANGIITTIVGNGFPGYSGDGGPALSAQINNINDIALDADGNLYIADFGNYRIRKVSANGIITTIAGTGVQGYSGDRGPAVNAQISTVWGLTVDAGGNLYMADYLNYRIRKIAANGIITTVAGNGAYGYSGDGGQATSASLAYPSGLSLDPAGNLYILDGDNYVIRKVATNGVITTIAGNGSSGYAGDGGRATSAQLGSIWGIIADATGNIYFSDSGNNSVRVLKPVAALLTATAVANGASNLAGAIAPGEIVTVYGSAIGPAQLTLARLNADGLYGNNLATTRVLFNGTPGPILYTWSTQVSAIVPYGISGSAAVIQVEYQGVRSDPIVVPIAPSSPALFTTDSSGKGQAAAFNENGSLNTVSAPAKPGSVVVLYATGEGQTSPAGLDGQLAITTYPKPLLPVSVTIDGKPAEILYAGAAPGIVAGLMQINARVPANSKAGFVPVVITEGSASSPVGVTIAVSAP